MPGISIILPTYQRTDYLTQALQSILDQTYSDWEALVIDDGPTEDTAVVVRSLSDARIQYIPQPHAGRSAARNRGLAAAQGAYIAFLDDDDLYLPDKLEQQAAYLEQHPAIELVGAGTQIIDERGSLQKIWRTWQDQPEFNLLKCLYAFPLPVCTVLFRRRALERLDSWFDAQMDLAEDTDFFIRLLLAGCQMAWLPETVSAYRQYGGNSQQDGLRYSRAYLKMLDKLFARSDIPAEIGAEQKQLYAYYWLLNACAAYAVRQVELAQQALHEALSLDAGLLAGSRPPLISKVAGYACAKQTADPLGYIDYVFQHLPAQYASLKQQRNLAHGLVHMSRLFRAREYGERPKPSDWLLGIYNDPYWLSSRGVWSILVRDILGIGPQPRK